jgi:hypothetical protein
MFIRSEAPREIVPYIVSIVIVITIARMIFGPMARLEFHDVLLKSGNL